MKSFRKLIALMLLAGFGVSFATVDAHSASFCDESNQIQKSQVVEKASDSTSSDAPVGTPDCHCQSSANCQFDGAVVNTVRAPEQITLRVSVLQTAFDSIFLDGLSRPPRAI